MISCTWATYEGVEYNIGSDEVRCWRADIQRIIYMVPSNGESVYVWVQVLWAIVDTEEPVCDSVAF